MVSPDAGGTTVRMKPFVSIATLCREVVPVPGGGQSLLGVIEGLLIPPPPATPPYRFRVTIACLVHFYSASGAVRVLATIKDSAGRNAPIGLALPYFRYSASFLPPCARAGFNAKLRRRDPPPTCTVGSRAPRRHGPW